MVGIAFQNCFVTPLLGSPLSFRGDVSSKGSWRDGLLVDPHGIQFMVRDGVPIFIDISGVDWNELDEEINQAVRIVGSNYERSVQALDGGGLWAEMCRKLSRTEGLILEIAIGLGGGFTPCILSLNRKAKILASDIDPVSIYAWRRLYRSVELFEDLSFAVFNATRMPLKSNSLDFVISSGGIGNIAFNYLVLMEAYRVLKSGGKLIFADGTILEEDFDKLPYDLRAKWLNAYPYLTKGYEEILINLGYDIELYKSKGIKELDPEEGNLPAEAHKHKTTLRFRGIFVIAVKP
jgi:ubiquinone/menaquinone biosynthesis C-methylase UbiE